MIVDLVRRGKRVGVTANSHKVIGNLLDEVAEAAGEPGLQPVRIGQKPKTRPGRRRAPAATVLAGQRGRRGRAAGAATVDVVGAVGLDLGRDRRSARPSRRSTSSSSTRPAQFSLANVLACAPAARSLVLLGDPQQLDQPTQGRHPPGAERSALATCSRTRVPAPDRPTIRPDEGLFLETTWRLHPDDLRLHLGGLLREPAPAARRAGAAGRARPESAGPLAGTGLRYLPVPHDGQRHGLGRGGERDRGARRGRCSRASRRGSTADGVEATGHRRRHRDRRAVQRARRGDRAGRRERRARATLFVGTVDKFQGQEAPISIYSMATSSPEDAPRGHGVPVLAQPAERRRRRGRGACAASSLSPALVRVACHTPRQMRLANALCLAVEAAAGPGTAAAPAAGPDPAPAPATSAADLLLFPDLGPSARPTRGTAPDRYRGLMPSPTEPDLAPARRARPERPRRRASRSGARGTSPP